MYCYLWLNGVVTGSKMRLCDHCDGVVLDDGGCANGCHRFTTDRLHAMVWYHGLERCLPALPTGTKKSVPFQLVYIPSV